MVAKDNWYCPAIPFSWKNQMLKGIAVQKVKVTSSTVGVILALHCAYKMNKSPNSITISHKLLDEFIVTRQTATKVLAQMEAAGFLQLERRRGRTPRIHLLLTPPSDHHTTSTVHSTKRNKEIEKAQVGV